MILVDSSVWISYFRNLDSGKVVLLEGFLDHDRVAICGIIEAELFLGTKNKKTEKLLKDVLSKVERIYEDSSLWYQVGRGGAILRAKGVTVPLSDLIIATQALAYNIPLLHDDKHFEMISKHLKVRCV